MEKGVNLVEMALAASAVEALFLHIPSDSHQPLTRQLQGRFVPDIVMTDKLVAAKQTPYKVIIYNQIRDLMGSKTVSDLGKGLSSPESHLTPDCPLYVNYTSGSTGEPRLSIARHKHVVANAKAMASWFKMSSDDVHLCNFHSHLHEFFCFSLYTGGTSVLLADFNDPCALFEALVRYQVTSLLANPATYMALQCYVEVAGKFDDLKELKLRLAICGGSATSERLKDRVFQTLKTPLIEAWGSTETTGNAIANPPGNRSRPGSSGLPIEGYKVSIVREDGFIIPSGRCEAGEVVVQGESVVSGYLADSDAKSEAQNDRLSEGIFRTGDVAYQGRDGYLYFQGRIDARFKVGGRWVFPEIVERIFREDKRLSDVLITAVPTGSLLGQLPAAMVVLSEYGRSKIDPIKLANRICQKAVREVCDPFFSMPRYCLIVESLPRSAGGKISRQEARYKLKLAVEREDPNCVRTRLKLRWAFKNFKDMANVIGKWRSVKPLFLRPRHALKLLREIL